jgi:uncharacterized protein
MADVLEHPHAPAASPGNAKGKLTVIDCDIHPSLKTRADLNPFLTKRWQRHLETYGGHLRTPFTSTTPYPRSSPLLARRDAWPPTGGPPGSDLAFLRQQHLDPINVEFGILQVLDLLVFSQQNQELGVALQRAINEWQIECWSKPEPRLKASIVVSQDNTEAAVAEIERCAATGKYVQVNVSPRANEPLGRRRYWPLYAAAEAAKLAARHPCRRLWRPRANGRRLAVLLQRRTPFERPLGCRSAHQPGRRRGAGALCAAQVCLY